MLGSMMKILASVNYTKLIRHLWGEVGDPWRCQLGKTSTRKRTNPGDSLLELDETGSGNEARDIDSEREYDRWDDSHDH